MAYSSFLALARLRLAAKEMASDIGLSDLNNAELDVFSAALDLHSEQSGFSAAQLLEHTGAHGLSRATLYRAVQSLKERGFFVRHKEDNGSGRKLSVNFEMLQ
jgi:predicted transcriptional regulator